MTEKRFYVAESNLIDGYCVFDREKKYAFHPRPRKVDCLNDAHTLNELHEENEELKDKNSRLQETLAFRSNQLALMEQLIDDLGSEEMSRQMELILND